MSKRTCFLTDVFTKNNYYYYSCQIETQLVRAHTSKGNAWHGVAAQVVLILAGAVWQPLWQGIHRYGWSTNKSVAWYELMVVGVRKQVLPVNHFD